MQYINSSLIKNKRVSKFNSYRREMRALFSQRKNICQYMLKLEIRHIGVSLRINKCVFERFSKFNT